MCDRTDLSVNNWWRLVLRGYGDVAVRTVANNRGSKCEVLWYLLCDSPTVEMLSKYCRNYHLVCAHNDAQKSLVFPKIDCEMNLAEVLE